MNYTQGHKELHSNTLVFLYMLGLKYLGLPLHDRKLHRIEVQPLIDKIGARLPGWKGHFLSTARRETLVQIVSSSQPIYHMTVFPKHKWLIKRIDRLRQRGGEKHQIKSMGSLDHQLINDILTQSERWIGNLGPRTFCKGIAIALSLVPMEAEGKTMEQA